MKMKNQMSAFFLSVVVLECNRLVLQYKTSDKPHEDVIKYCF